MQPEAPGRVKTEHGQQTEAGHGGGRQSKGKNKRPVRNEPVDQLVKKPTSKMAEVI